MYRNPVLVPVKTHVAAPASASSLRLTAKPAREELVVICSCTGPLGVAGVPCMLSAVDKRGRKKC